MANLRLSLPFLLSLAIGAVLATLAECKFHLLPLSDTTASNTLSRVSLLLDSDDLVTPAAFQLARHRYLLELRGGGEEEDEYEESEEEEDEEESEDESDDDDAEGLDLSGVMEKAVSVTKTTILPYSQKMVMIAARFAKKVTLSTAKAIRRAVEAGIAGEDEAEAEDDDEPVPIVQKIIKTISRMIKAAVDFEDEEDEDAVPSGTENDSIVGEDEEDSAASDHSQTETMASSKVSSTDFGSFLAKSYGVVDERDALGPNFLGGSLTSALQEARAQARMLVVFLPSSKPGKKAKAAKDDVAIESMLSEKVVEAANKKARKSGETGSFLFWGAKSGSSEATSAAKRLKAKLTSSKGDKRPVLMVVYPAMVVDSSGLPKVAPKVVAQHHCSPPPSASLMAAWLNALRKRHGKQYNKMQTELKELQYYNERKEGYKESTKNDKEREAREADEEAKRVAAEKLEKEHQDMIAARREELKSSLHEEASGREAKKIALRFTDGRSGQRRFSQDQALEEVFNWIDAIFEMERETVVLTTMNGKLTLTWEDAEKTLLEAGLGKNTGFRVSVKEQEESDSNESDNTIES